MATESVTEASVGRAIQRLANVQGILTMTVETIDKEVIGSPLWEASEALRGAIELVQESYCTLADNSVSFSVGETQHGN